MTCRTFDPSTASLNHSITVLRTDDSTLLLNVPRDISDFTVRERKPGLLDRLVDLISLR